MEADTTLTDTLETLENKYDNECKKVLAEKSILARIMKECMWEYKDEDVERIATEYIEGIPAIGTEKVFGSGSKIKGLPTEMLSNYYKGKTFFDVRYRALLPSDTNEHLELIINVEAQTKRDPGYSLVKRAGVYCSSMVTNQYGTEFQTIDYNAVKKVYSIWICHDVPSEITNTMTRYDMVETPLIGDARVAKRDYDLMSIVMVHLSKKNESHESKLLGLLNLIFSTEIEGIKKPDILENEYGISKTVEIERSMMDMCNMSQGIKNEGIMIGIEQEKLNSAKKFLSMGLSLEQVAEGTELSIETVKNISLHLINA